MAAWFRGIRSGSSTAQVEIERPLAVNGAECGGAFELDRPSPNTTQETLAHGWTAELVAGSTQLTVRGPGQIDNHDDAFCEALAASQEALDLVAMRGGEGLAVVSADSESVAWWTDRTRLLVLRIVAVSDMSVSTSVTATVVDQFGNVKPPPPPPLLPWRPSLRYFRLAQATGDLFDAYRNMYLALESLLSDVAPPKVNAAGKQQEGEGEWLKRALRTVDSMLPLGPYAPPSAADPVSGVFDDLYAGTRSRLFHAKSGRPVLLPHTHGGSRDGVLECLARLARLFVDLFAAHFAYRRPSGAMTYAGFARATSFDTSAVISDDAAPAGKSDMTINPTGGSSRTLTTRRAPELSKPGLTFWLGEDAGIAYSGTGDGIVRRVGLRTPDGGLLHVHRLVQPVTLKDVHVLEVQQGIRLVNNQQPRFRFDT